MITRWLVNLWFGFLKLFVPPPPKPRKINPDEQCPACGAEDGRIRAVTANGRSLVEHACNVCSARFYEAPVLNADPRMIHPEDQAQPAKTSPGK